MDINFRFFQELIRSNRNHHPQVGEIDTWADHDWNLGAIVADLFEH